MSKTYQTGKEYILYGTLTDPTVSPAQKRRVKAGYRFQGEQHLEPINNLTFNKENGRMEVDYSFDESFAGKTIEVVFYIDTPETGFVTVMEFEEKYEYIIYNSGSNDNPPVENAKHSIDEWVYNKETGEYEWDPNVTSADDPDLKEGYEYIGKLGSDVHSHFEKNLSNWLVFKRAIGGNVSPNMNTASFISAALTPKIENAFIRAKEANQKILDGEIEGDYELGVFYPIDFNIAGYGRKQSVLSSNTYFFKTTLKIGIKSIPVRCQYTIRNSKNNKVSSIVYIGTAALGGGHSITKNAFRLDYGNISGVLYIHIEDVSLADYIKEYINYFSIK